MVKCAFKGCGKIQKKYTKESFHRFPVKNGELYKLWLLNAGLDIHTPVEKGLNMRVCSAHFATTDIRKTFCGYSLLKPNAVPSTVQTYSRASDKQVISAVPQSMPVKNTTSTSGQPRTIQPPSSLVTEASSSPAMETLGFRRGLDRLLQAGIGVDVLATDRTPSIRKIMRERYPGIEHRLDIWHVAKGIRKKLMAVANDNKNIDLLPWLKSINNHLWWSWQTCGGDSEELKRRWTSILYHICGIHRWEEDGVERTCYHHQLSAEEQRRKKWLPKDSPAFQTLSDHVLDKNLLKDLNHMTLFKHTGDLEAYHSTMLKYTQKRLQFVYNSMKARTLMSVMDYNEKVRRQQARNADGTLRYSLEFPKQTKRLVARGSYEPTTQTFKQTLVERVLERLQDSSVKLAEPDFDFKPPTTVPS
ncbi:uncharacterized protein LOC130916425 isoform X2 [Corythoichthys intestinalis]|uniref:uncharacterized protein LOC130916425 isoform X2 n=1 Tax=Corythoichthys intestinalis TaxID=161448 RepID=UPI0025A5B950|nr:uncharacterized protein LOC130916425 isoform X2 [Corythoichthys intestinalis]